MSSVIRNFRVDNTVIMAMYVTGQSGNKGGRPKGSKFSVLTTKGRIERFLGRNLTARSMQGLYMKLSPKDQMEFLTALLPYVLAKQTPETLSNADVERIFEEVRKYGEKLNVKVG